MLTIIVTFVSLSIQKSSPWRWRNKRRNIWRKGDN